MIKKSLAKFWNDSPNVRSYVGGRVFLLAAHQDQPRPYVILHTVTSFPEYNLLNQEPCAIEVVQADIYADTVTGADDIAEAIRMRTSSYRGPAGDDWIDGCTMERDNEFRERQNDGKGFIFRRSVDYRITYSAPVPTHT